MNKLKSKHGFLLMFKRGLFFTIFLIGIVAAPFITLAHHASYKPDAKMSFLSYKKPTESTSSFELPNKNNPRIILK